MLNGNVGPSSSFSQFLRAFDENRICGVSSLLVSFEHSISQPDGGLMAFWTDLVQRILSGDGVAEGILVNRIAPAIRVIVRRRGAFGWADANDLSQEVLAELLIAVRSGQLRDPEKLSAFAAKLAHNVCVDAMKRTPALSSIGIETIVADPDDSPPKTVERREEWAAVMHAIRALTEPRDRTILTAFYIRGDAKTQICSRLSLTPGQFDRVIHRARERVRKLILKSECP